MIKINSCLRLLLLLALLLIGKRAAAQQEPQYTQYMFNTLSVNPAYAGTRNAMNLLFLTRQQWVGLDGAPKTYTFAMHTPITSKSMGLGFSVVQDQYGPVNNLYLNLNYAYRIKLSEKLTLSMGLKAGIYNYYASLSGLPINSQGTDPIFSQDYSQKIQPNFGAGLYLYHQKYYAGIAIPKLLQPSLSSDASTSNTMTDLKRHFYIIGGYVFELNHDWKLKSSMVEKVVTGAPLSTDLTAQALYNDIFWFGASYRVGDAVALLLDVQITPQLLIGYSYDMTISRLANYSHGSHEILISYDFDGLIKSKVKSPRYF